MDSYARKCRAPFTCRAATLIREEEPPLILQRGGGGGGAQTLSKRPGLHISWHITDVLPQLRRQLIKSFMKGQKGAGETEKVQEGICNMTQYIKLSFTSFFQQLY